jgi:hypothetical protein
MRAVLELAGIHDILTKSLGSSNPINVVLTTYEALRSLRTAETVAKLREKTVDSQEIYRQDRRRSEKEGGLRRRARRRAQNRYAQRDARDTARKRRGPPQARPHRARPRLGYGQDRW